MSKNHFLLMHALSTTLVLLLTENVRTSGQGMIKYYMCILVSTLRHVSLWYL